MVDINTLFYNRAFDAEKLTAFGFVKSEGGFSYTEKILDSTMELCVKVSADKVEAAITDLFTGDLYTLHLMSDAAGAFIGDVRNEYDRVLTEISDKCFEKATVFRSDDAKAVIEYVTNKYGDELEFLWEKFAGNAIFRRKDNQKWYAALLTVEWKKLGVEKPGKTEVIDLRMSPDEAETLIDNKTYFRGYHMNKKSWLTIALDGSMPQKTIFDRIDISYALALKK